MEATRHLAELAKGAGFIFFSSDLVFDGERGNYAEEKDEPNPVSFYGEMKAEAEGVVMRNPGHTVVRVGLNSGKSLTGRRSFNEEMAAIWRKGGSVKLFDDEFRCPIPAAVTARAIWEMAAAGATGIFHLAGSQRLSRVETGRIVARHHPEVEARIEVASRLDYKGPKRPADVSLNCAKVQRLLSFRLPGLGEVGEL